MRIIFMGTPDFAVPALGELLASGHEIAAVYTQAPKPAGRGHKLRASPVQDFAETHGLEVRCPANFKAKEDRAAFAALEAEVAIVVAYGLLLPRVILEAPTLGCLNLHGSMLPRWRGAAPIQRAIMAGDAETAIQVMQMEAGLDTGPVLLSETIPISGQDTAASLHDRMAQVGAGLLPRALAALERGGLTPAAQGEKGVVYAHKLSNEETRIDWSQSAEVVDCHIRGLSPFPGAWFEVTDKDGKNVRVKALFSQTAEGSGPSGSVLQSDEALVIACGSGAITLRRLQRAGKGVQDVQEFLRGFPIESKTIIE